MAESNKLKNPFVGLRTFDENESYLFYGRSSQTAFIINQLRKNRFLAAIGSSGSGKSSLIKSGTIPAVYSGLLESGKTWRVVNVKPGTDPIGNLANAFAFEGILYDDVAESEFPYKIIIENTLRRSKQGITDVYKEAQLPENVNLLIVVDQFEELYRYRQEEKTKASNISDAQHFVELILDASQQNSVPVFILITLRSDFLGECAMFNGLPELINKGQYLVPRMTRDEVREVIMKPITIAGGAISARLITRLLNDVGDNMDQLPVLQHALMRTWDAWIKNAQPNIPMDITNYESVGGWENALSNHADEAFNELNPKTQQPLCEKIFRALSNVSNDGKSTRNPLTILQLAAICAATKEEVIKIIEVFRRDDRAFLMPPSNVPLDENSIIDVSHESLLRLWKRLVQWNEEEKRDARIYTRLTENALLYKDGNWNLYTPPQLDIALDWYKNHGHNAQWALRYNQHFDLAKSYLLKSQDDWERGEAEKRRMMLLGWLKWAAIICLLLMGTTSVVTRVFFSKDTKGDTVPLPYPVIKPVLISNNHKDSIIKINSINVNPTLPVPVKIHDTTFIRDKGNVIARYYNLIVNLPIKPGTILKDSSDIKIVVFYDFLHDTLKLRDTIRNILLYEKLYYLMKNTGCYPVVQSNIKLSAFDDRHSSINKKVATISNDGSSLTLMRKTGSFEMQNNARFTVYTTDKTSGKIYCATSDNYIYVFDENDFKNPLVVTMGNAVTALSYEPGTKRLYFGTAGGEIGFIDATNPKQTQVVYKNKMKTAVSAIDYFVYDGGSYLLATTKRGNAVVFEINDPCNDNYKYKMLQGVEAPLFSNSIEDAWFSLNDSVVIARSANNIYYRWNPFGKSLINELKTCIEKKDKMKIEAIQKQYNFLK